MGRGGHPVFGVHVQDYPDSSTNTFSPVEFLINLDVSLHEFEQLGG